MKILLIEDDEDLGSVLRRALPKEGIAVDVCENGEEGLYRAINWDYDAIVLDLLLPGLDGRKVLASLRREKPTPVLVLTASSSLGERLGRFADGADDFLSKPFEFPELVARLRALARRGRGAASDEIALGDLVIDTRRLEVRIGDRTISFTRGEFEILERLVRSPGRVVPRAELFERLSQSVAEDSNAIDVHIHNLRRKLGASRIQTRRGVGYVFAVEQDR